MLRCFRSLARQTYPRCSVRLCSATAASNSFDGDLRSQIVAHALSLVTVHGWTEKCLAQATMDMGLPALSYRVVERGPVEIVEHFLREKRKFVNEAMDEYLSTANISEHFRDSEEPVKEDDSSKTGDEKIAEESKDFSPDAILQRAIELHIDYLAPHNASWPSAMALLVNPQQIPYSTELALDVAGDLVEYSGLKPMRSDWYTERALLMAVYSSTELFMLSDTSEDFKETRRFLAASLKKRKSLKDADLQAMMSSSGQLMQSIVQMAMVHLTNRK